MNLAARLSRIERLAPPPPRCCPACGLPRPGTPVAGPVSFDIGWREPGETKPPPCRVCGQSSVIWIEFDKAG